ncbi:MAG: glycosyltransferase [Alphaproteobacteria bacterium]
MKILLSAYACEPGLGSEPAVGWHWAVELARLGHEVRVLTREANRPRIEQALAGMAPAWRPGFLYYDLPRWTRRWKRGGRGIRLYYLLWQWGALRRAREVHANEGFERVHHVTFAGVRQPSFMGRLGVPFVFGPLAGGERAPPRLRRGCGLRGRLLERLRDGANQLVRFDPLMAAAFRRAARIYVTSEETRDLLPRRFRDKARVALAIGWDGENALSGPAAADDAADGGPLRLLFAGRLVHWKGLHLGLAAFRRLLDTGIDARLTVVGHGPDARRLRRIARELGLDGRIDWTPWLAREALAAVYVRHHVLLYPSLHDSGGMVVLEALGSGLPVVCLDLGGPGVLVDADCGRVVATAGRDERRVAADLAEALAGLAADPEERRRLAAGARRRADAFRWRRLVQGIYDEDRER